MSEEVSCTGQFLWKYCFKSNSEALNAEKEQFFKDGNFESNNEIECKLLFKLNQLSRSLQSMSLSKQNENLQSKIFELSDMIRSHTRALERCLILSRMVLENASGYDYRPDLKYNGYRSIYKAFKKYCEITNELLKDVHVQPSRALSTKAKISLIKSKFKECLDLVQIFETLFELCDYLQNAWGERRTLLFVDQSILPFYIQEKFLSIAFTHQKAFYGSYTSGFQFSESLRSFYKFLNVALAAYSDGCHAFKNNSIGLTTVALLSGSKYLLKPGLIANKLDDIMKNADITTTKGYIRLADLCVFQVFIVWP
jgi:hypothetical protein